jgi:hypothetical protein
MTNAVLLGQLLVSRVTGHLVLGGGAPFHSTQTNAVDFKGAASLRFFEVVRV